MGGDFALAAVPGSTDACRGGVGGGLASYYCEDPNKGDRDFPVNKPENDAIKPGSGGSVNGGLLPASLHAWASFDVALWDSGMVGIRIGYASNGYPQSNPTGTATAGASGFPPLHIEARFTWFILKDVLRNSKDAPVVAPYLYFGLGATQMAASVGVPVVSTADGSPYAAGSPTTTKSVNAWAVSGPFFISVPGVGARIKLGTPHAALSLGVKPYFVIGGSTFLFAIAPELALQFGF